MASTQTKVEEIIFMGTGTSDRVPNLGCLVTRDKLTGKKGCSVCRSSLTADGKKNKRSNASLLVRFYNPADGAGARLRNVLIDCGKGFHESAREIFHYYDIEELDAILITHGHADACHGLDDLRQFQNGKKLDVYLSDEAMTVVRGVYPYLIDTKIATGGGAVALLNFHLIDLPEIIIDQQQQSFSYGNIKPLTIHGLDFIPLIVKHGVCSPHGAPFACLGFYFDGISYISDADAIPSKTFDLMKNKTRILIVDALRWTPIHISHFSIEEALKTTIDLKPFKSYLTGFTHQVDQDSAEKYMKALEKGIEMPGLKTKPDFEKFELHKVSESNLKVAPAFDGLRVNVNELATNNKIIESSYFTETEIIE